MNQTDNIAFNQSLTAYDEERKALGIEPPPKPLSIRRRDRVAEMERNIMQSRLAEAISKNRRPLGVKKLTYSERLKLRIQVNKEIPQ